MLPKTKPSPGGTGLSRPDERDGLRQIKERLNYPVWQLTGILGVVLIATLYFLWRITADS